MTLETVEMWRIVCNGCGVSQSENSEYYAWADKDTPLLFAEEDGWLIRDDGHWCENCCTWDEEGDERIPRVASGGAVNV